MRRFHHPRASRFCVLAAFAVCAFVAHAEAVGLQRLTGTIAGVIADDTAAPIGAALVKLTTASGTSLEVTSGANGRFSLTNVPPGPFRLTVSAPGFAEQTLAGSLAPGEVSNIPEIRLRLAAAAVSIDVRPSVVAVAEQQVKEQEQQRVLGVIPNFYVSFIPDAAPMNTRQKFHLSWKARTDPMQFAFVAIIAGVQQRRDDYPGFGDGMPGYAKRYAAAYATGWTGTMMTRVLLPSLLHQDPRYFYKGSGSTPSRIVYAMSRSVLRKGDNGRWQPNYSGVLGPLAAAAISNYYYPEEDRRGARLMLTNAVLGIAGTAVGHVAQEFLYARFTSRSHRGAGKPLPPEGK